MGLFRFKLEPTKQDLTGKVGLITGASDGLGIHTATMLAEMGISKLYMAVRNLEKGEKARQEVLKGAASGVQVELLQMDLASLETVNTACQKFLQDNEKLDILICNAGIEPGAELTKTVDGFELGYQVNHVAHFLLIARLLSVLTKSPHARVLLLSSDLHYIGAIDLDNLNGEKSYDPGAVYGTTKLVAVVLAKELARRLPNNVVVHAVHPGFCETGIITDKDPNSWRTWFLRNIGYPLFGRDARSGGANAAWAATAPEAGKESGLYVCTLGFKAPKGNSFDAELGKKVWERSIKDAGLEGVDLGT